MNKLKRRFLSREPEVHRSMFGECYVTIDDKRYEIIRRSGDDRRWVVREAEGPFSRLIGEEKIVERDWLGNWKVKDKFLWD